MNGPGGGQVDFAGIFFKLAQHDQGSPAVMECCLKPPSQGAAKGAPVIAGREVAGKAFDGWLA